MWWLLVVAGLWAGVQNALAGGGSFVTLPALILSGIDARAANITSTIALFPGQVTTGLAGRRLLSGAGQLSFRVLFVISLAGGVVGALLLLATPAGFFARLLPWLVLAATAIFAWGSFRRQSAVTPRPLGRMPAAVAQFLIAIYGGYFGGGIGFLMLAALTIAGLPVRTAGATKNVLAAVMNGAAVVVFAFSRDVHWLAAAILGAGAIVGGLVGAALLQRVNETALRIGVVVLGLALFAGLLWRVA
ncbi:MAG TPA: sulfite exporter TauE/SafE family protein [Caulobacteraceae bacterium]|jgi:hypothetical protein